MKTDPGSDPDHCNSSPLENQEAEQNRELAALKARVAELEKRTLRTVDHPEAKGRAPKYGDQAWTLSFPLEDGSVLKLEMGKESYDKFSQFLLDEMANAPDYDEGEGIANEVVCLRTQLATTNAQNAELVKALEAISRRVPIMGSSDDYREGQLHALEACREVAKAARAQSGGKEPPEDDVRQLAADCLGNLAKLLTRDDGIDPEAYLIELTPEQANLIKLCAKQAGGKANT